MIYEVPIVTKMPVEGSIAGLWANRLSIMLYGIERRKGNNRNFSIKIEEKNDNEKIILYGEDRVFNLNSLLPAGVETEGSENSNYFHIPKQKVIHAEGLDRAGSILILLHEIKHAHLNPPISDIPQQLPYEDALKYLQPLAWKIKNEDFISEEDQKRTYDRIVYIEQAHPTFSWETLYKDIVGESVPLWFTEISYAYTALEEIICWDYAVKQARVLENLGFNVLSDFKSEEEMQRFINSCLASYERGRYRKLSARRLVGDIYYPIFL